MHGREIFVRRKRDVRGKALGFRIDTVRLPNGALAQREYLDHPGAVALVPVLPGRRIVMVRQYRFPVGTLTWELPAGKLDPGENPRTCARRELEEETGFRAGRLVKLTSFWPTPAFANELIHIYTATDLQRGTLAPDHDEFLSCRAWGWDETWRALQAGRFQDSKTLIGLMAFQAWGKTQARRGRRKRAF